MTSTSLPLGMPPVRPWAFLPFLPGKRVRAWTTNSKTCANPGCRAYLMRTRPKSPSMKILIDGAIFQSRDDWRNQLGKAFRKTQY